MAANAYLTAKAYPGKGRVLLENAALLALCAALLALVYVGVYGWQDEGISAAHAILLAMVAGLIALLNLLTERKRARMHALLIVHALTGSHEGHVPVKELEKQGLRRAEDTVNRLLDKGYLTQVIIRGEDVWLADRLPAETAPKEEIKPIFRN